MSNFSRFMILHENIERLFWFHPIAANCLILISINFVESSIVFSFPVDGVLKNTSQTNGFNVNIYSTFSQLICLWRDSAKIQIHSTEICGGWTKQQCLSFVLSSSIISSNSLFAFTTKIFAFIYYCQYKKKQRFYLRKRYSRYSLFCWRPDAHWGLVNINVIIMFESKNGMSMRCFIVPLLCSFWLSLNSKQSSLATWTHRCFSTSCRHKRGWTKIYQILGFIELNSRPFSSFHRCRLF